jgi:hypothetical protein
LRVDRTRIPLVLGVELVDVFGVGAIDYIEGRKWRFHQWLSLFYTQHKGQIKGARERQDAKAGEERLRQTLEFTFSL